VIQPGDAALLAGLGGVLVLDRTALLQSMASRPLVASSLAGHVLGAPALGLLCGCLLELLWLMELPVGASIPPNDTLAALLAVAFAVAASPAWGLPARAALGVFLALPFGYLGRVVDVFVRRWNGRLLAMARQAAAEGRGPAAAHFAGALAFFGAGAATTAAGAVLGTWGIDSVMRALPTRTAAALEISSIGLFVAGVAAVLASLRFRGARLLFGAGFLGGLTLEWAAGPLRAASRILWRP
jgi:mannose/fructose/N-acetylgalactosamine-specific phosphotransferase system component IIC